MSTASAAALMAVLACGGGTDVAPPTPQVSGDGLAQFSLDGVSLGQSEVVSSLVSGSTSRPVSVTGESVQFGTTPFVALANRPLTLSPVALTGPGGAYSQGVDEATCTADPTCQFWVEDFNAGVLGRNAAASNPIPTGVPLSASYQWTETLQSVQVSISYGNSGDAISVTVHNIGRAETGPFTVTTVSAAAPPSGSKAFDASVQTGLLQPAGQKRLGILADPGNRLDITSVDLSNALNPCIQGHVVVSMTDTVDPDPLNPNHLDGTFDDSDC